MPGRYNVWGARGGGKFSSAKPKSDVEWAIYRASRQPGPGQYSTEHLLKKGNGGKFSTAKPKSDVEWTIYRASQQPGPGDYEYKASNADMKGGKFSAAKPKSDVEWAIYRAGQQPGPGDYEYKPSNADMKGGKFSTAKPKSDVEWQMYRASQQPGPGDYDLDKGKKKRGIKISEAKPKSDVEWAIYRASRQPGPGQYSTDHLLNKGRGGKFSTAKPKSDVEWRMYRAAQIPGPTDYSVDLFSIGGRTSEDVTRPASSQNVSRQASARSNGNTSRPASSASHSRAESASKDQSENSAAANNMKSQLSQESRERARQFRANKKKASHKKAMEAQRQKEMMMAEEQHMATASSEQAAESGFGQEQRRVSVGEVVPADNKKRAASAASTVPRPHSSQALLSASHTSGGSPIQEDHATAAVKARVTQELKRAKATSKPGALIHSLPVGMYTNSPVRTKGPARSKFVKHTGKVRGRSASSMGSSAAQAAAAGQSAQYLTDLGQQNANLQPGAPLPVGYDELQSMLGVLSPKSTAQAQQYRPDLLTNQGSEINNSQMSRPRDIVASAEAEVEALARKLAMASGINVSQYGIKQRPARPASVASVYGSRPQWQS